MQLLFGNARAILRATLELARQLELSVVAERAGTQSQFDWLRNDIEAG